MNARNLAAFGAGLLFATGLATSGMTQPAKVIGFLDFTGDWDPSLAFVMLGAVTMYLVFHRLILRRPSPLWADLFAIPPKRAIDKKLLIGASVFGIGWGLAGYCPGPALTSLGSGSLRALVVTAAMLLGIGVYEAFDHLRMRQRTVSTAAKP